MSSEHFTILFFFSPDQWSRTKAEIVNYHHGNVGGTFAEDVQNHGYARHTNGYLAALEVYE